MKIALMTNNYKPFVGGVPISVERLKKGLEDLGHEVTVFAPTYENQVEEEGVFRYQTLLPRMMGGIVLPNSFDRRIEKEFQKKQYDIIHVHHPMLIGRTAVYLSKKYNIPLTFTYHTRYEQYMFSYVKGIQVLDNAMNNYIQYKAVPWYLNMFMKHCDYIFAPTVGMQQYLQEVCKVSAEKIAVLPTGIEQDAYEVSEDEVTKLRKAYNAEEIPLFLSVSRMANEKNVEFLLESISKLKKQFKKPFRVLFVGEGPDRKTYEKRCQELKLEEEVIFTGQVANAEIAPYFAMADAFIFASKTETQGIVILEAFAGKTPVYALRASGVSDLVTDGFNGRLYEENSDYYAKGLLDFLNGKENVEELSKQAYETALDFKEDAVAVKAVHHYNKVIAANHERLHSLHNNHIRRGKRWKIANITF